MVLFFILIFLGRLQSSQKLRDVSAKHASQADAAAECYLRQEAAGTLCSEWVHGDAMRARLETGPAKREHSSRMELLEKDLSSGAAHVLGHARRRNIPPGVVFRGSDQKVDPPPIIN